MLSRLNSGQNTEADIYKAVDRLKRFEEELKNGRAYTSGRSGVLAYIIPNNNANDIMDIRRTTAPFQEYAYSFTLAPTGSMSFDLSFKITNIYRTLNQDYPVTSPYLEVWANNVKLELNLQGNWTAGDGSTWGCGTYFSYLDEITNWDNPKLQQWQTFFSYFSTVPITIKIKMRIKSTDKGTIENIAVIF